MENVTESLAGRAGILELHGLSLRENVNVGEGGVICLAKDLLPLKGQHKIMPLWAI